MGLSDAISRRGSEDTCCSKKKRLRDEYKSRMTAMSSQKLLLEQQVAAASASTERHKEEAATSRGILSSQNAKIEELMSCVADLQRQLKSRDGAKARDHSSDSSTVSVRRRSEARPATDDEDENACESSFRFWRERDKGLDISERCTSQYLAGELSLEAFTLNGVDVFSLRSTHMNQFLSWWRR